VRHFQQTRKKRYVIQEAQIMEILRDARYEDGADLLDLVTLLGLKVCLSLNFHTFYCPLAQIQGYVSGLRSTRQDDDDDAGPSFVTEEDAGPSFVIEEGGGQDEAVDHEEEVEDGLDEEQEGNFNDFDGFFDAPPTPLPHPRGRLNFDASTSDSSLFSSP
jgi:hypothetical protein